jgi:plasmid stabilization system protein ParE
VRKFANDLRTTPLFQKARQWRAARHFHWKLHLTISKLEQQERLTPTASTHMARVQVTTRALADLERLFEFIVVHNPKRARERTLSGRRAFELLSDHPLLGRPAEDGRRELLGVAECLDQMTIVVIHTHPR